MFHYKNSCWLCQSELANERFEREKEGKAKDFCERGENFSNLFMYTVIETKNIH